MKNNTKIVSAMRNSYGRFFGLYTKSGEALNARFLSETPYYVIVEDRNNRTTRKFAKESLAGLRIGGTTVGTVA